MFPPLVMGMVGWRDNWGNLHFIISAREIAESLVDWGSEPGKGRCSRKVNGRALANFAQLQCDMVLWVSRCPAIADYALRFAENALAECFAELGVFSLEAPNALL